MTLTVYTARMGYRADSDWLDITRGGNAKREEEGGHRGIGLAFAPSSRLLGTFLQLREAGGGELTDRQWLTYLDAYTGEMRASFKTFRPAWDTLLSWERVVLLCMCTDAARCHRTILGQQILPKLGAIYSGEIG